METPKKPVKKADAKSADLDDEVNDTRQKKKFDDDDDDYDMPLDDMDLEDYDDFDDDDY